MEIWLLKMVYLLSASWALESILCLTIEKWSKLLRGAHPRESNFCLTIEFGLTIKIWGPRSSRHGPILTKCSQKCPVDLTVYNTSHQAPFIFSDADYMKRNERKEACNRTLENRIMSYWSHQFLLDPFVDAVLVGSLPQRDGLALCCALYFSGWFLL